MPVIIFLKSPLLRIIILITLITVAPQDNHNNHINHSKKKAPRNKPGRSLNSVFIKITYWPVFSYPARI